MTKPAPEAVAFRAKITRKQAEDAAAGIPWPDELVKAARRVAYELDRMNTKNWGALGIGPSELAKALDGFSPLYAVHVARRG